MYYFFTIYDYIERLHLNMKSKRKKRPSGPLFYICINFHLINLKQYNLCLNVEHCNNNTCYIKYYLLALVLI